MSQKKINHAKNMLSQNVKKIFYVITDEKSQQNKFTLYRMSQNFKCPNIKKVTKKFVLQKILCHNKAPKIYNSDSKLCISLKSTDFSTD